MRDLATAIGVKYDIPFKFHNVIYKVDRYTNTLFRFNTFDLIWERVDYKDNPNLLWELITCPFNEIIFDDALKEISLTKKEITVLELLGATKVYIFQNIAEIRDSENKLGELSIKDYFPSLRGKNINIMKVNDRWVMI